jgi:glutamate-ammonia-ligase adenylyltransferase
MTTAIFENSPDLLLQERLTDRQVRNLLAPVGFERWENAGRCLRRIADHGPEARQALAKGLPSLLLALSETPSPDRVLVNFERFVQSAAGPAGLLQDLATNPRGFEILFALFTGSQFLTEILLRHPEYYELLVDHKRLAQPKSSEDLHREVQQTISPFLTGDTEIAADPTPALDALRRFQRRELLRVGTCDLLGLLDLPTVTSQLSYLADSLVEGCLTFSVSQTNSATSGFVVIAMGKLGGQEINYSSDIDLLFLAAAEADAYVRLGQNLIDTLARTTAEGFLYRVDMRLRPWGSSGALVNTVVAHISYLRQHAGLWERQALLKARPIAGNLALGREFLSRATPIIFKTDREPARAEIHKLKQRIEDQLHQRGRSWGDVKLGQGSIRDIEFVTQYLQLVHGDGMVETNGYSPNTLEALFNLSSTGVLPGDEYRVLSDGYVFLRTVEHHLQLMHYRQTHTLPEDEQALTHLARRLGFQGPKAGPKFTARYLQHSAVIRAVYHRHLANGPHSAGSSPEGDHVPDVLPLLTGMHPTYAETFSDADIEQHAILIEQLDEDNLVEVKAVPLAGDMWQVTVVGYDYLGELSLICGLLFLYGFNIISGDVFTYGSTAGQHPETKPKSRRTSSGPRRFRADGGSYQRQKIVDVFTVRPVETGLPPADGDDIWPRYAADLASLCQRLQQGEQREVQGKLAERVAVALGSLPSDSTQLLPVDVEIDNDISESHTVLRISAVDTAGFLYEFTNALALTGINVQRTTVASIGSRVQDTLYVTDAHGRKILSAEKARELRVATVLIKHFTHLLPQSPNPASALLHFREFIGQLFRRPDWPDEIASIRQPEVLGTLARLLGVSDFLWNDFLRMQYANLFPVVQNVDALATEKAKDELREELVVTILESPKGQARRDALNAFKDREMFRIDMRQIQEHITEFGQFSAELTDLAEVVVGEAYRLVAGDLRKQFGLPRLASNRDCPLSVCALGKCGGQELGFASDIELMLVFAEQGRTTGPRVITTGEFFDKVVQELSRTIQAKREGVFEVDLRLRPYGSAGSMAVSLESFRRYFGPEGDAWPYERQALVKLRPIAGDLKFGMQVVSERDRLIYTGEPFDTAAMRAMRERQLRHLVTAGTINAKFSPGALVDVEYLIQGLQISHGHRDVNLRQTNTGQATRALAAANIIPAPDYPRLREAHIFLRRLINALRMVRGNAKDLTVPAPDDEEFAFLARRLHYDDSNLGQLQHDLTHHTTFVYDLSRRLLD